MDYCEGGDLFKKINNQRGIIFPEEQVGGTIQSQLSSAPYNRLQIIKAFKKKKKNLTPTTVNGIYLKSYALIWNEEQSHQLLIYFILHSI